MPFDFKKKSPFEIAVLIKIRSKYFFGLSRSNHQSMRKDKTLTNEASIRVDFKFTCLFNFNIVDFNFIKIVSF